MVNPWSTGKVAPIPEMIMSTLAAGSFANARIASGKSSRLARMMLAVRSQIDAFARMRRRQRTRRMLRALDDRMLHDIGISRGEINSLEFSRVTRRG